MTENQMTSFVKICAEFRDGKLDDEAFGGAVIFFAAHASHEELIELAMALVGEP